MNEWNENIYKRQGLKFKNLKKQRLNVKKHLSYFENYYIEETRRHQRWKNEKENIFQAENHGHFDTIYKLNSGTSISRK